MSRVICIDAKPRRGVPVPDYLVEGNFYKVKDCPCGCGRYALIEHGDNAADKSRFIPIDPTIDETQMERNYDKIKELV